MEEIVIDEKKYVSSKQAAKITGYAKDYIGQLCREGRVTARLVGRSWYVLESAIKDHRFGDPQESIRAEKNKDSKDMKILPSTWKTPRYEAVSLDILPSVHREEPMKYKEPVPDESDVLIETEEKKSFHDAWRSWFENLTTHAKDNEIANTPPEEASPYSENSAFQEESEPLLETEPEILVPIHAIYAPPYVPKDGVIKDTNVLEKPRVVSNFMQESRSLNLQEEESSRFLFLKTSGVVLALFFLVFALISSGIFDKYLVSHNQDYNFLGITKYFK